MDDAQEVIEYGNMDHSAVNDAFVSDLMTGGSVGPKVVDLGCGNAAIPVLLCQRDATVEVLGIDSSVAMLEAAKLEIELGSVLGRIFLEQSDCKTLPGFDTEFADTVMSNTVLHHIEDPLPFLGKAVEILARGGRLFVRDLLRPESESELESLVDRHAANNSDTGKQLLRQSLHAAFTLDEMTSLLAQLEIPPTAIAQTSDRHWTLDWTKPTT